MICFWSWIGMAVADNPALSPEERTCVDQPTIDCVADLTYAIQMRTVPKQTGLRPSTPDVVVAGRSLRLVIMRRR
jgi:hypothetical protein